MGNLSWRMWVRLRSFSPRHIKLNVMIIYVIEFVKLILDNWIRKYSLRCLHIRHQDLSTECVCSRSVCVFVCAHVCVCVCVCAKCHYYSYPCTSFYRLVIYIHPCTYTCSRRFGQRNDVRTCDAVSPGHIRWSLWKYIVYVLYENRQSLPKRHVNNNNNNNNNNMSFRQCLQAFRNGINNIIKSTNHWR